MHAKPDLRVVLKWMINRSGSVITDVIQIEPMFRFLILLLPVACLAGCDVHVAESEVLSTPLIETTSEPDQDTDSYSTVTGNLLVSYTRVEFESGGTRETASAKCDATKVEYYPDYILVYNNTRVRMLKIADLKVFDIEKR